VVDVLVLLLLLYLCIVVQQQWNAIKNPLQNYMRTYIHYTAENNSDLLSSGAVQSSTVTQYLAYYTRVVSPVGVYTDNITFIHRVIIVVCCTGIV